MEIALIVYSYEISGTTPIQITVNEQGDIHLSFVREEPLMYCPLTDLSTLPQLISLGQGMELTEVMTEAVSFSFRARQREAEKHWDTNFGDEDGNGDD